MRRSAVWLLIALLITALVLPGVTGAKKGMYETQVKEYTVHDDGSANVTFNLTFYGPPSYLNSTRAEIKKVGLKNYTAAYVSQLTKKLEKAGYDVKKLTATIIGYNSNGTNVHVTCPATKYLLNGSDFSKLGWRIINTSTLPFKPNVTPKGYECSAIGEVLNAQSFSNSVYKYGIFIFRNSKTAKSEFSKIKDYYTTLGSVQKISLGDEAFDYLVASGLTASVYDIWMRVGNVIVGMRSIITLAGTNQQQYVMKLIFKKLEALNGSMSGTNGTAPITVIVRASLGNFAHYFSWGNVWEIRPDLLMVRDLLSLNVTRMNVSVTFNNTFIYHLPKWAKIIKTPGSYFMQANGSVVNMTSKVINDTIYVHSYIHFKKGITTNEFRYLYSKPRLFLIEYTGKKGPENYVTWASSTYENFTVRKDGSALITITDVYKGQWASYVRYKLAMMLSVYGASRTERVLAYYRAKGLEEQGLKITNATAKLYGSNSTKGPLNIRYEFVTAPSSSTNYVIKYRPKLGFANFTFPDKALISINKSEVLQVKLPEGWKFTEVPKSVSESVNGTVLKLNVSRSDNTLKLYSYFYMRYGTPNQTLAEIMKKAPTVVSIGYSGKPVIRSSTTSSSPTSSTTSTTSSTTSSTTTSTSISSSTTSTTSTLSTSSSSSTTSSSPTSSPTSTSSKKKSICGPAAIIGLALLPLLLRKRR